MFDDIHRRMVDRERNPDLYPYTSQDPFGYRVLTRNWRPARLPLDMVKWWSTYPMWPTIWAIGALVFVALALAAAPLCSVAAVLFLLLFVLYWLEPKRITKFGNLYPCIVVSESPPLIATWADLTLTVPRRPVPEPTFVVRVSQQPLAKVTGCRVKEGDRVVAISMYVKEGTDWTEPCWQDLASWVGECLTRNEQEIKRMHASIPGVEWMALVEALKHVPTPHHPGLYKVPPPSDPLNIA
jgi:hypothetical protein